MPSTSLYGAELRPEFIELGYELFKDKETIQSTFLVGDLFTGENFRNLEEAGGVDVVYAASIFHLFDWGQQVKVAERVVGLLKKRKGSVVLGRQRGNRTPTEYEHRTNQGGTMFRHNEESWREMWRVVGEKTVSGVSCAVFVRSAERRSTWLAFSLIMICNCLFSLINY